MKKRAPLLVFPLLTACSLAGDLDLPKVDTNGWWKTDQAQEQAIAPPASNWWTEFGSDELNRLIESAFQSNTGYQAALARMKQAEAEAEIAGASLLPTVTLDASGQVAKKASTTSTTTTSSTSKGAARSYQFAPAASYELDFWGKNLNTRRAAEASLAASRFDSETVAITLAANVATSWFQLLALDDRVAVARNNLDLSRQSLVLFEQQESFGKISALDAAQQRSTVALIEARLPALELQRRQALSALAVLTGISPAQLRGVQKGLDGLKMPDVAAGLPSDILLRRPDIAKAEADLQAAQANIGVARAQLFPSVTLTAERGQSSIYLANLLDPKSIFWSLGTSITATLFDNGKLMGGVHLSQAKKEELVANYRGAVLSALKDVADALDSKELTASQEMADAVAAQSAREAWTLADIRYREGAADYLSVLQAQSTLLEAEDGEAQARLARMNAAVSLFRALAGGGGRS